jgi:hypothetical protein
MHPRVAYGIIKRNVLKKVIKTLAKEVHVDK